VTPRQVSTSDALRHTFSSPWTQPPQALHIQRAPQPRTAAGQGAGAGEATGISGEDFIRGLRNPQTFEHLVDGLPDCVQKDLLQVWGYVGGIYPRLPTLPHAFCSPTLSMAMWFKNAATTRCRRR
jgi:hypothetical protein